MAHPQIVDEGRYHRVDRKAAHLESRREREFYRYYEPIQALTETGPLLCNLYDESATRAHRARSSPDPALTAFCQLGALRLRCRRAMLFFFDSDYAYILAEATKTLSLQNDDVHDDADQLWLGHTVIPRGFSICEETVARLPSGNPADPDLIAHIINDLDDDVQFCGKPYVRDGPRAKFYAGVPITTSKGINIGAYCCLDDQKRDGLDAKDVVFLQDIAKTVMAHLEYVRAKAEHERGTRMVSALDAFMEGAHSVRSWERESRRRRQRREHQDKSGQKRPLDALGLQVPAREALNASVLRSVTPASPESKTTREAEAEPSGVAGDTQTMLASTLRLSRQTNLQELQDMSAAPNISDTFHRAAQLIREAVDADGVAFLASSADSHSGSASAEHDGSDQSSDAPASAAETGTESEGASDDLDRRAGKPCRVLASSHSREDGYKGSDELQHDIQTSSITERFLQSLLRRNPGGKIWNFSGDGVASSDDSSSESGAKSAADRPSRANTNDRLNDPHSRRTARRRRSSIEDGRKIQRLFPGVRSLALCGMWDQNRRRWYSACATWTYSPLRIFSQESEVSYTAAFCDVIMAEVYRLEAQNSDKSKSDFISSISHELRSPLHGILGSVECLQDIPSLDDFTSELVAQVDVCGRTLLDIVEHLLDYSKINHQVKASASTLGPPVPLGERMSRDEGRTPQTAGLLASSSDVSLDAISEEVVEAAVYSYCCSKTREYIFNRKVSVILDIDHENNAHWQCTFPVGAWKRICINLVSNALKYTSEGFIHISLKTEPSPGKRKRMNALLTVQDTGRGMSRQFLNNHFFRAFSQEDDLVEGTGLGMSLVAKIVKAMGGKVDVHSQKGVGTTVSVTCPLDVGRALRDSPAFTSPSKPFKGHSIGLLYPQNSSSTVETQSNMADTQTKLLRSSIQRHCTHLGVETQGSYEGSEPNNDIYLILEQDLSAYGQRQQQMILRNEGLALKKPLIIICDTAISARQLRETSVATTFTAERIEYISQPCGTTRLGKAIRACLSDSREAGSRSIDIKDRETAGAVSSATGRPQEHEVIERKSSQLSLRTRIRARATANQGQALNRKGFDLSPQQIQPRQQQHASGLNADKSSMPIADYLTNRSKSTGDEPRSPRAMEPALQEAQKYEVSKTISDVLSMSSLSMLLVDDNPINLRLLVTYATKHGHRKITAVDGHQAVEAYKAAYLTSDKLRDKPEVVLMDINMPVMNGFEATRMIRSFEQQHGVQPALIVALTGLGSADAQQEAFNSGVDLYLTKPVRLKELTKVLAELRSSRPAEVRTPALREM